MLNNKNISINNKREANIAIACLTATWVIIAGLYHYLATTAYASFMQGDIRAMLETIMFATIMFFVLYGNILYHICLIGYYKRRQTHTPPDRATLEQRYLGKAPSLSTIIPAYKEERSVNWQTMMSAALAEYPNKNVVLLIDDPYSPNALADILKLEDTRLIPGEMQALFDAPAAQYRKEQAAFEARKAAGTINASDELKTLAAHYDNVAAWLEHIASDFMHKRTMEELPFADRFFVDAILYAPARAHKTLANEMRAMDTVDDNYIERHYARLVGLFSVSFSSFERKKYANLSHEANKAMNLNSYISLIGKSWKEVEVADGKIHLVETSADLADFTIPDADYVNTIDSDSLMLCDYALRLIDIMERPENDRLAVIQSPCSAFPGAPKGLERTAGSCIDVQFLTHQGYTYWGASFWVGANAMLRRKALEEIKETRTENGNTISIYIQDRTVIEDTESTIDLVHKGWRLYNYPERMTFSATPPDFGSLLIQRRRWSNGGLLILPKLLRYTFNSRKNVELAKEFFMRFHYLASTTTGCIAALLFLLYPFDDQFSTLWLPMSVVPFFILYTRDLRNAGYHATDALRVCAMNLMLVPIVTGGVLKSFQQMITGKKIPFGRTPKIPGRTAAPALYCIIAVLMPFAFIYIAANQLLLGHVSQSIFALINACFLTYALVYYIGVKAAFEDITVSAKALWRSKFHNAEIIQMVPAQHAQNTQLIASKQA